MVEADEPDLFTFLRLAVNSGARRSQLCALQWGGIDLTSGAVKIARAVVEGEDGFVVKSTKTDRIYRLTLDAGTMRSAAARSGGQRTVAGVSRSGSPRGRPRESPSDGALTPTAQHCGGVAL